MPIYMEISNLHRTVTLVARGKIAPEEIRGMAQQLTEAKVRSYAKIVEVAGATTEFTAEQVVGLAQMMRGDSPEKRGPVAFIIDQERTAFPKAFAHAWEREGPIRLFTSLREARHWLEEIEHGPAPLPASAPAARTPVGVEAERRPQDRWADPNRQATMIRGGRMRDVAYRGRSAA
jgi:hypothetical protein